MALDPSAVALVTIVIVAFGASTELARTDLAKDALVGSAQSGDLLDCCLSRWAWCATDSRAVVAHRLRHLLVIDRP
jgi:hypothetical protein